LDIEFERECELESRSGDDVCDCDPRRELESRSGDDVCDCDPRREPETTLQLSSELSRSVPENTCEMDCRTLRWPW